MGPLASQASWNNPHVQTRHRVLEVGQESRRGGRPGWWLVLAGFYLGAQEEGLVLSGGTGRMPRGPLYQRSCWLSGQDV